MRIFLTGATGLIGRRLVLDRLYRGDRVVMVSRRAQRARALFAAEANRNVEVIDGDPATTGAWMDAVDGCDAVVNLAGAGIADRRWTPAYRRRLASSRLDSTAMVVHAIEAARHRPAVLVNASAAGWYGETGSREVDESAVEPGRDFLGRLCEGWEREARGAEALGVRVVRLRTGIVLDPRGGAVPVMARPFRWFLGGPVGRGRHYMPWIHWRDVVGLVGFALEREDIGGPLNAVAPNPVTNRAFSRALAHACGRPSWLPVPPFALRLAVGDFARYLVMSQRVVPRRALAFGYRFLHERIEHAMEAVFTPEPVKEERGVRLEAPALGASAAEGARPRRMPRLVAIDVDGTLLRSDGRLAQGAIDACRAAQRAGAAIVLASGRTPRGLNPIVHALGINAPTINYNGALIWNPRDDRPQFHQAIAPALAGELVRLMRAGDPDVVLGIEVLDRWYTDRADLDVVVWSMDRPIRPDAVGPLERFLTEPVSRLAVYGDPAKLDEHAVHIREHYGASRPVALYREHHELLQIVDRLAEKAICLQRMAEHHEIEREDVMAIGNGDNDLGMLEWAGFAVAMANATESVKGLADTVVPSNDDNGVARALQRYVLGLAAGS